MKPAVATPAVPSPPPTERGGIFSAIRFRDFRFYWLGMILSVISQNMEFVSLAWLVLTLTNSPLDIGLTGLVNSAPIIGLNLVGGAAADRVNRQRLIVGIQGVAALLYLVLATLVVADLVQFWHVLVFAFAIGSARAFDGPARMAMLPQMVPKHELPSAVALMNIVWQLPRMVGPALAGLLIAAIGVGPALYLCGGAACGAMALFGILQLPAQVMATGQSFIRNIIDGLSFVRNSPIFSILIGMTFFNSVFGLSYTLMEAVFARDILHVGSAGFGFMEAAGGVGAISGVLVAAYFARRGRKGLQAIVGAVVFGILLIAFALSPWYAVSLVLLFFCGLFNQIYMTTISTTLQMTVPDAVRGRVMGLFGMTYSLIPLGGTIAGAITEVAGAPVAVSLGGFLVAATALIVAVKSPHVRNLE